MRVLLYSKYSQHSKRLTDKIEKAPVNLFRSMGLYTLCIDNESVRNQVVDHTLAQLSVVPAILVVYPDGGVEKFEGEVAFSWVDSEIRSRMAYEPEPPSHPEPVGRQDVQKGFVEHGQPVQQQPVQQQPVQQQPVQQQPVQQQPVQQQPVQQQPVQQQPVQQQPMQQPAHGTAIGDLLDDIPARPPAQMRVDASGYEQMEFPTIDDVRETTHAIKAPDTSGMTLAEKAAMMQQSRETDDQKHSRPGAPPMNP